MPNGSVLAAVMVVAEIFVSCGDKEQRNNRSKQSRRHAAILRHAGRNAGRLRQRETACHLRVLRIYA